MKKFSSFLPLLVCALCATACGNSETSSNLNSEFYDKDIPSFGIARGVPKYQVKDTIESNKSGYIKYHGRYAYDSSTKVTFFSFTNAGFEVTFTGTTLVGEFYTTGAADAKSRPFLAVCIDNDYDPNNAIPVQLTNYGNFDNSSSTKGMYDVHSKIVLAHSLENKKHTIRVYKRSEALFSRVGLKSLSCNGSFLPVEAHNFDLKMEVFGDSVSCGYAVESDDYYENFSTRTENGMKSFANYAANILNSDISSVTAGGYPMYKSIHSDGNYPSTVPGMFSLTEIEWRSSNPYTWDNSLYVPDVVVIALGGNDGTYVNKYADNPTELNKFLGEFKAEYLKFINKIYDTYPDTIIVLSDEIIPVNRHLVAKINEIYSELKNSKKIIRATYSAWEDSINRVTPGAGHPNDEMQQIAGRQLASIISDYLNN